MPAAAACRRRQRQSHSSPAMESYGAELTSPPLPLVALIGPPELLPPLADYLRTQHAPRLQSLGVPDAHSAAGASGACGAPSAGASAPGGIAPGCIG